MSVPFHGPGSMNGSGILTDAHVAAMATDENSALIEPRKGKREQALPPAAILTFTPLDLKLFSSRFLQPPRLSHKIYLSEAYTGECEGVPVALTGPMLGAPQAVMVLEKMIALGVKRVIAVGWCGSLQGRVTVGDVVVPTDALSEEGTSAHYPVAVAGGPGPSIELRDRIIAGLVARGVSVHGGSVWTTDAPYRETRGKVRKYQQSGILAVDMETSALFTLAAYRQIQLAVVLTVSDELHSLHWVHGYRASKFLETREKVVDSVLSVIAVVMKDD